jgi:integrase
MRNDQVGWRRLRVERGIYLQPNGKYAVRVVIDGRARLRVAAATLEEAREQRERLSDAARRGELPVFPRLTFAEAAARWLQLFEAKVAAGERRERTLENYRYQLEAHLLPTLGRRHLQSLTADQIADLIAALQAQGLAPRTVSDALTPLGSILRFALRRGYILDNPLRRLEPGERPRALPAHRRTLTRGQLARLLAARPSHYRPLLATAAYSGVRLSELLGLSWSDIDFAAGLIHVRCQLSRAKADSPAERVPPKTAAAVREIPLAPQLALLLARHRQASRFRGAGDYVFSSGRGTPLGHRNVERRALGRAAERAGINREGERRLRFHDLRHTFASHLIVDLRLDVAQVSRIPRPRQHEHHARHLHPPLRPSRPHRRPPRPTRAQRVRRPAAPVHRRIRLRPDRASAVGPTRADGSARRLERGPARPRRAARVRKNDLRPTVAETEHKSACRADVLMELGGLEPPTSWVRSRCIAFPPVATVRR